MKGYSGILIFRISNPPLIPPLKNNVVFSILIPVKGGQDLNTIIAFPEIFILNYPYMPGYIAITINGPSSNRSCT